MLNRSRAAEKQAARHRDAAAAREGRKSVAELRRENEAFTFARSDVSIGFKRSFSASQDMRETHSRPGSAVW